MVTRIQNRTNQVPAQQDIPYRTMQPSTEGNEIIVNSLLNEPSTQKEKSRTQMFLDSKYYKYGTFCFQIFLLAGVVTAIILSQTHYHLLPSVMSTPPQLVAPTSPLPMISPPLQFHHAFFHLKSSGYTDLGLRTQSLESSEGKVGTGASHQTLLRFRFHMPQQVFASRV
ncbi:uncharacterized protein LOC106878338 isoform X2 [Octopus bimaculoides]|uniref:uncharacterized protein LOC106878338 isoform X2 n=1 Tax=Octopus bimaculoides TaxID=37653 RepID=UPI0022E827A7|nr:uncharacterized protein LOC106878338 isoform X2 [Octopus bimaculoides]